METLYLGVGRSVITPEVGGHLFGYRTDLFSESVADDLTATAFWFRQDETQALMISVTVATMDNSFAQDIAARIEAQSGISPKNVMISCTHTHSGPAVAGAPGWGNRDEEYCNGILIPRVLEAVAAAKAALRPVTVGIGTGESLVGINRRQQMPDNSIALGQNPWGSFDPKMTVLSFRDADGNTYANIVHYGCHGTGAGSNTEITRDWSGVMIDRMELLTGGITAFFNGTDGDTGPRLSNGRTTGRNDIRYAYEIGNVAAQDAVRIWKSIGSYRDVRLQAAVCPVKLPLKPLKSREAILALLESPEKTAPGGMKFMQRAHYENALAMLDRGDTQQETLELAQPIVRIGEAAFYGSPFEVFSEIAMRINTYSGIPHALCVSHTNGCEYYFPTQSQLAIGGYEVDSFLYGHTQQFVDNADWHMITQTVENLKQVAQETDAT